MVALVQPPMHLKPGTGDPVSRYETVDELCVRAPLGPLLLLMDKPGDLLHNARQSLCNFLLHVRGFRCEPIDTRSKETRDHGFVMHILCVDKDASVKNSVFGPAEVEHMFAFDSNAELHLWAEGIYRQLDYCNPPTAAPSPILRATSTTRTTTVSYAPRATSAISKAESVGSVRTSVSSHADQFSGSLWKRARIGLGWRRRHVLLRPAPASVRVALPLGASVFRYTTEEAMVVRSPLGPQMLVLDTPADMTKMAQQTICKYLWNVRGFRCSPPQPQNVRVAEHAFVMTLWFLDPTTKISERSRSVEVLLECEVAFDSDVELHQWADALTLLFEDALLPVSASASANGSVTNSPSLGPTPSPIDATFRAPFRASSSSVIAEGVVVPQEYAGSVWKRARIGLGWNRRIAILRPAPTFGRKVAGEVVAQHVTAEEVFMRCTRGPVFLILDKQDELITNSKQTLCKYMWHVRGFRCAPPQPRNRLEQAHGFLLILLCVDSTVAQANRATGAYEVLVEQELALDSDAELQMWAGAITNMLRYECGL